MAWNIRAGGGARIPGIAAAIQRHAPDVLVLCEYRVKGSAPLVERLAGMGLIHAATANPAGSVNGVLIAAHAPFGPASALDSALPLPHRLLDARFSGFLLTGVYMPNLAAKRPYWEAVASAAAERASQDAIFLGDFNTTRHYVDEAGALCGESAYMDRMAELGYRDAWRERHPDAREYTWFSHKGNGFRLDHAFVSCSLAARIRDAWYSHAEREQRLSDHSALLLDLADA